MTRQVTKKKYDRPSPDPDLEYIAFKGNAMLKKYTVHKKERRVENHE